MRTKERRENMKRLRVIAKNGLKVVSSNECEVKCEEHSSRWSRFVNKVKSIFSRK